MRKIGYIASAVVFFLTGFLIISFHLSPPADRGVSGSSNRAVDQEAESDWFIVQRAFPFNDIPRTALPAMTAGMKQFTLRALKDRSALSGPDWTLAGPSNIGGRITAVALDPNNGNIIYAAAASGGVWKSNDFGTTWFNIFNESFSIGSLALSPENPGVIYVGTGEANPSSVDTYPGNGIWRSTDGGGTWTNLGLAETGHIGKIVINPLNPNTIFVSTLGLYRSRTPDRGIYRSLDHGSTWSKVLYVNDTTGTADIVLCPSDTTIMLSTSWTYYRTLPYVIRGGPSSGLYRSTDGGSTWTHITNGIPHDDATIGRISLSFAPSNGAIAYALVANGGGYNWGGVYKSTDTGLSWVQSFAPTGSSESQVWYNNMITVHPTNPNIVWAGMTTLYRSTDGGSTFPPTIMFGSSHVDYHALEYTPGNTNTIVLGNDGGIYTSTDGGTDWTKSLDLPITQYYAGTVSLLNPNRLLGGTQDNGSSETQAGTDPWSFIFGGDGFYCLIDPTDSMYVYAETQYGGLVYSTNGGFSFAGGTNGLDNTEFMGWETPIAMDPQHPKTLYTGLESVYRTKNNMQSWTKISGNLTNHISSAYSTVSTIDVSPVDSNVIIAGTGDGKIWITTNGGALWTDVSSGLPLHWVTRVVADPDSSNIVYVTLSGFREYDSAAHVFMTRNFGATWTNIGGSLPDIPVNDLIVDPVNRSYLYIATDMNVMKTSDRGTTWGILGSALPVVTVHDLAFHPGARELVAFTHGRSVFTMQIPDPDVMSEVLTLNPRWNLISNPLDLPDDSVGALFPSAGGPAFAYDSVSGYVASQTIVPGKGYWVRNKFGSVQTSQIYGHRISAETLRVFAGWNLIGSVSSPVPVGNILTVGTTIVSQLFGFDGGYLVEDSVKPGNGYWLKVGQSGTIILGPLNPSGSTVYQNFSNALDRYNRLVVTDGGGNRGILYFGRRVSDEAEGEFEMPPVPPGGFFDVRFGSNTFVSISDDHPDRFDPIRLSSSIQPLAMRWEIRDSRTVSSLVVNGHAISLAENGSLIIPEEIRTLGIRYAAPVDGPRTYSLRQNYPNPFNPSTVIMFTLPGRSQVRLTVYDALGHVVKTLLDGSRQGGEQSVSWNGTDLNGNQVASGLYIYRIEAKNADDRESIFRDAKKMILLR